MSILKTPAGNAVNAISPMDREMQSLAQAIEELRMRVESMRSRLSPISQPRPPMEKQIQNVKEIGVLSQITTGVRNFKDQINGIGIDIDEIMQQLEI